MNYFASSYARYVDHLEQTNETAKADPIGMVEQIEFAYRRYLGSIVSIIAEGPEWNKVILLAGPSSSGKTAIMKVMKEMLRNRGVRCATIFLDDFYRGESQAPLLKNGNHDYKSMDALNVPALESCMMNLTETGRCDVLAFDFSVRQPTDHTKSVALSEGGVVISGGIHTLNPRISAYLLQDHLLKLYISVKQDIKGSADVVLSHSDLRSIRRVVHSYSFRGAGLEQTLSMWQNAPDGENNYIRPYKSMSNITISSIYIHEPRILCRKAIPPLHEISCEHPRYRYTSYLLTQLERSVPMDKSPVPEDSVLREFIGGSTYQSVAE